MSKTVRPNETILYTAENFTSIANPNSKNRNRGNTRRFQIFPNYRIIESFRILEFNIFRIDTWSLYI
jgi:hypothetical protein